MGFTGGKVIGMLHWCFFITRDICVKIMGEEDFKGDAATIKLVRKRFRVVKSLNQTSPMLISKSVGVNWCGQPASLVKKTAWTEQR